MNDEPTLQPIAAHIERLHREWSALKADLENKFTQLRAESSGVLRRARQSRSNDNEPQHDR
jgi:hypothetical protein